MASLRRRLGTAFLTLVVIMIISGSFSIYFFMQLGDSIDKILRGDYYSALAAANMIQVIERQQTAQINVFNVGVDVSRERFKR